MKLTGRTLFAIAAGAFLALAGLLAPVAATAQEKYPSKPITVLVPFGAGGGFDQMVRAFQPVLEEKLGVPLAIQNKPGAGGRRGAIQLYRTAPDGYTIGLTYFLPFLTDRHILKKELPIDLEKFAVIYRTTHDAHFLYVRKNGDLQTIEDFGKQGRPIRFSTTGVGSSAWVGAHVVAKMVGFEPAFISGYKTLSAAALGVARGDADASFGGPPHFGGVIDDVKPLVYLGGSRSNLFPDVPTGTELGYPNTALLGGVHVFSAPPGTDAKKVAVLREAFAEAVKDKRIIDWAKSNGTQITPGDRDDVFKYAKDLGAVLEGLQLKVEK